MKIKAVTVLVFLVSMALFTAGCGTVPIRNPLPEGFGNTAEIPDIPNARFWGDESPPFFAGKVGQPREKLKRDFPGIFGVEHNYLSLSGGGANGAFGACSLVGWTAAGNRPEFTMVTGISTGVLMATFAFLGKEYDDDLKEMYTSYSTRDLVRRHNILAALTGASAADTSPLKKMLAKYLDKKVMEEVAAEHGKRSTFVHRHDEPGRQEAGHMEHRSYRIQRTSQSTGAYP